MYWLRAKFMKREARERRRARTNKYKLYVRIGSHAYIGEFLNRQKVGTFCKESKGYKDLRYDPLLTRADQPSGQRICE